MRRSSDDYALLRAELAVGFSRIEDCAHKNVRMKSRLDATETPDEFDYAVLGYTLYNLYNAFEAYFLRIAKFFENNLDAVHWHKDLVERMRLEIPGLRAALFTEEFSGKMDELRRFRHAFRNLYQSELEPERLLVVNKVADILTESFPSYHSCYLQFLENMQSGLYRREQGAL